MPNAAQRPCAHNGCPETVARGRCATHTKTHNAIDRRTRGNANERGYTYRWQQYSKRYLRHNPLCKACQSQGRATLATLVDHIIPVKDVDDVWFWISVNHQGLCTTCHSIKTRDDVRKGLTRVQSL